MHGEFRRGALKVFVPGVSNGPLYIYMILQTTLLESFLLLPNQNHDPLLRYSITITQV